jgi:hypothetical protein
MSRYTFIRGLKDVALQHLAEELGGVMSADGELTPVRSSPAWDLCDPNDLPSLMADNVAYFGMLRDEVDRSDSVTSVLSVLNDVCNTEVQRYHLKHMIAVDFLERLHLNEPLLDDERRAVVTMQVEVPPHLIPGANSDGSETAGGEYYDAACKLIGAGNGMIKDVEIIGGKGHLDSDVAMLMTKVVSDFQYTAKAQDVHGDGYLAACLRGARHVCATYGLDARVIDIDSMLS